MAEAVLLAVGKSVLTKVADLAGQEISLAWFAKDELRKLRGSLDTINVTVQAFEEGQYVKTSPTNNWLEKLKDVAYDAEDVLDEFATEVSRQRMEQICFCSLDEVWEFSSRLLFNFKMGCHIKEIRKRLDNITIDRNNFHPSTQPSFRTSVVNSETSSSLPNPSNVIGRDEEKDAIVKLLKELEPQIATDVPVIPIVGMGGVGKTTLARLVFNDEMIKSYFNPRIWVCVSDDFDAKTIAKKVIECITKKICDHSQMEVVQDSLRKELDGKRYLLVLDDVWNENHDKWVQLKGLLMGGKEGSKILVTTRSKDVASVMSTTSSHLFLGPLSNEIDCWSMFKQRAFHEGEEEKYKTTLVPIGQQIVRKCQGVPLAITALGSLLHSDTNKSYWEFVRDNEIWKLTEDVNRNERKSINILLILKFSYDHLPSHLKACFAYCSLFPKDHEIVREALIQLWMANGLIQSSNRQMEDVGNQYFDILFSRSFFQDAEEDDDGSIISCKMHDLMHDLARSISGTEYWIVGENTEAAQGGNITPPQGSARHIWLSGELNPQLLIKAHQSRTLLKPHKLGLPLPYNKCLSFKRLRALDLRRSNLERLPDSICELKHLRYLDLSRSRIRALPDSFSRLQNLQTLNVSWCKFLRELPKDMWKMAKLRHIINERTPFMTHMPSGLGQLSSLQTLSKFVVGDKNIGGRISELGPLNGLRGGLHIQHLERVKDLADARKASLEKKQNLNYLALVWDSKQIWNGRQQHDEYILGHLHPPTNLKKLLIDGYAGVKFPYWTTSTLERLVSITMGNFSECQHLLALGNLPSLQFLNLRNMPNLECIDGGFTSLEHLNLYDLPKLEKWEAQLLSLPRLTTLEIKSCPSLVAMPFFPSLETWVLRCGRGELLLRSMRSTHTSSTLSGIPTLKSLQIFECDDLECLSALGDLPSLRFLHLEDMPYLECIDGGFTALETLYLFDLPKLEKWGGQLSYLPRLTTLEIADCPSLVEMPFFPSLEKWNLQWGRRELLLRSMTSTHTSSTLSGFRTLKSLYIYRCDDLECLPAEGLQNLVSLEYLSIFSCNNLKSLSELQHLSALRALSITACHMLISLPISQYITNLSLNYCENATWLEAEAHESLTGFRSLQKLHMESLPKVVSLPKALQHATSLQSLDISFCDGLTTIPEWLTNLTSLQQLRLLYCPLLTLPEGMQRLTRLQHLKIWACPQAPHRW